MTSTIAIARAASVPGFGFSHKLECIAVGVNSGDIEITCVPLYFASQKKWASGILVTAGLLIQTSTHLDLYTEAKVSPV